MPTALEKHIKRLTNALIISGTINISLFATFLYLVLKDKHTPVAIELKPAPANPSASPSADQVLRSYFSLSFPDLLLKLENKDHVEDGLTSRDLSLACLITFHHFNLERALGSLPLQKREIIFHHSDEQVDLAVYPGLADTQFDAILHYAKTEKWPLTNQGLFFEIQRSSHPRDPSLLEAFTLTPEFHTVFTLFHKTNLPLEKETLITLLAEGSWDTLTEFTAAQQRAQELTLDKRRTLLLSYLNAHSKTAASLLLLDLELSKRLDDTQLLTLLDLTTHKSTQLEILCREILVSPRTDLLHYKAAIALYALAGETPPKPLTYTAALARFISHQRQPDPVPTQNRTHVVQTGDNLTQLARKYNVSIEAIKQLNHLESDRLRLGKKITIPD